MKLKMKKNTSLHKAKVAKNDEFYTLLSDIEEEMVHYKEHFKGKFILCNCDNPDYSNFWVYFHKHFKELGLKKLMAIYYSSTAPVYVKTYDGTGEDKDTAAGVSRQLDGNGDFRSEESIDILKQADIVITNPPFSLLNTYLLQLLTYNKKFIVLGTMTVATNKLIFPYIKEQKIWLGHNAGYMSFKLPMDAEARSTRYRVDESGQKWRSFGNICWYTNLDPRKNHQRLETGVHYKPSKYPVYDNYPAIDVGKVKDIPMDYTGVMGVPLTFLTKFNPDQFTIIGHDHDLTGDGGLGVAEGQFEIKGKGIFKRILIQAKAVDASDMVDIGV